MPAPALAGFLTGSSLIIAIGAQNAFVLRQGLLRQHRLTIALICAGADALLIVCGIHGVGTAIARLAGLLDVVRIGGAAFLAAYGCLAAWRAWKGEHMQNIEVESIRRRQAVAICLALTFLNPHVYLDTVILLGSLANQHGTSGRWAFGAGAMLASFAWFFLLAYGAALLQPVFTRPGTWRVLDAAIAVVMSSLALGLVSQPIAEYAYGI